MRKQERNLLDELSGEKNAAMLADQAAKGRILNSKVSIYQKPKLKPLMRKAINDTYLCKYYNRQEDKK